MDVLQAVLDGIAIAAIFNGAVAALVLINPRFFLDSYPKDIQKAAPVQMTKQEKNWNLFRIFSSKSFAQGNWWFLECVLDGIYTVEYIKPR